MNSSVTKQPLISVIVPVYNIIPYLPRCVESLRGRYGMILYTGIM